ncbi:MAG: RloB domain-containing protein [Gammaproteobacteria bacterium]|nr:RloB domain-containing protein [Gammaproteobacteria bacterium]
MAKRKPRRDKDLKRRGPKREAYDRVLIICEGEKTEPFYFQDLCAHYHLSSANIEVTPADGSSPVTVVKSAKRHQKQEKRQGEQFDRVYCVFDRDEHPNYDAACDQAKANGFELVTSVPCFEYWLLLHFEYTAAPFSKTGARTAAENVVSKLRHHIPDYGKGKFGLFSQLIDHLETAKKRAVRGIHEVEKTGEENPSTRVYELVDYLQRIKG